MTSVRTNDPEVWPGGSWTEWLLETGTADIIESNNWHDTIWGACTCHQHQGKGENHLGLSLMKLRAEIAASLP